MEVYGHRTPSIIALADRLQDCAAKIRWGGGGVRGAFNGGCAFQNGCQQLQCFNSNGVPTVEWTQDYNTATAWIAQGAIVLGRRVNHTQGRDIITLGNRHFPFRDYWVKYQPAIEEWRFHIFKGRSIARAKKIYVDANPPTRHPIIRSRRLHWHMEHESNPPKGIRKLAKEAVKAVGYDFGAVDILILEDKSFRVLEVNSRPALRDESTLAAYEAAIRKETTNVHV